MKLEAVVEVEDVAMGVEVEEVVVYVEEVDCAPPLTLWFTMWASNGNSITQPNIPPLVVFFPWGATRELSQLSSATMPIVSLHQENFS